MEMSSLLTEPISPFHLCLQVWGESGKELCNFVRPVVGDSIHKIKLQQRTLKLPDSYNNKWPSLYHIDTNKMMWLNSPIKH